MKTDPDVKGKNNELFQNCCGGAWLLNTWDVLLYVNFLLDF